MAETLKDKLKVITKVMPTFGKDLTKKYLKKVREKFKKKKK